MLHRHCFFSLFCSKPLGRSKRSRGNQFLIYADEINLLGHNINTTKKNTEAVIDASNDVGVQVGTLRTRFMLSRHRERP
jgi:hypothetical protein